MQHTNASPTRESACCHAHGGKAWIARLTSLDAKFGFVREFVAKRDVTRARSNVYRDLEFDLALAEGAIYEYCYSASSGRQERGFWIVRGGDLAVAQRGEVVAALESGTL